MRPELEPRTPVPRLRKSSSSLEAYPEEDAPSAGVASAERFRSRWSSPVSASSPPAGCGRSAAQAHTSTAGAHSMTDGERGGLRSYRAPHVAGRAQPPAAAPAGADRRGSQPLPLLSLSPSEIRWIRKLGAGDYGEVWLVRHEGAKREMAAKRIKSSLLAESAQAAAFLQEVRLLSSLRHANVVKVFGVCPETEADGCVLFVELCAGSWRQRLDRPEPIAPLALASVLRSVAAGMAYLHAKGIVHSDLKGENVLLRAHRTETDEEFACVSDMGLARHVDLQGGRMTVRGTCWVMAPEMLRGSEAWDGRADVFAFGLLILESLTRLGAEDIPRTASFLVDWPQLRQHVAAASGGAQASPFDEALLALAVECCAAEPDARPSFLSLADRLEALLASEAARAPAANPSRLERVAEEEKDGWLDCWSWLLGSVRALPCMPQPAADEGAHSSGQERDGMSLRSERAPPSPLAEAAGRIAACFAATPPSSSQLQRKLRLSQDKAPESARRTLML